MILIGKEQEKLEKIIKKIILLIFLFYLHLKSELKRRLIKRGRDNKNEINLRLSYAINEMKHYNEYKYVLINEKIQKTVNEIKKIIEYNEFIDKKKKIKKN